MKNVVKMMLVGVTFLVATPAWAACNLAGSSNPVELKRAGTPMEIAVALKEEQNYPAKHCTLAEIEAALRSANGWNSNEVIPVNYRLSVPLLVATPAPAPQSEPVAVATSVPEIAVTPPQVEKPSPELTAVRAELQTAKRERIELATRVKSVAALPAAALTSGEREMLNKAATLDQRIAKLEGIEARMASAEAVNAAQSRHLAAHDRNLKKLEGQVAGVKSTADTALATANAALAEKTGWTWWDAGLAVMLLLAFVGLAIVFIRKPKKADVRAVVDEALQDTGLSHTVLRAEIDELKTQVEEMGDALPADIRLDIGWEDTLAAATPDEQIGLQVIMNTVGKNYEPAFTIFLTKGEGDTVYCTAGIQGHNPDNAISAANLERTVRKAGFNKRLNNPIGRGPRAVAAAG